MKQLGTIDVHGLSIRGRNRESNQDHFAVAELAKSMKVRQTNLSYDGERHVHGRPQGQVLLVADGISEGPSPSRASSEVIDRIVQYFLNEMPWYHLADGRPEDVTVALKDALSNAQDDLRLGRGDAELGIVTTLALAFVSWPDLYVAHLGRNRCYIHRQGVLHLLTTDHEPEALEKQLPEVQRFGLELGDVLALCSDGLTETRSTQDISTILDSSKDSEQMCGELVTARGPDDRTAIVVRFLPREPVASELDCYAPKTPLRMRRKIRRRPRPRVSVPRGISPSRQSEPFRNETTCIPPEADTTPVRRVAGMGARGMPKHEHTDRIHSARSTFGPPGIKRRGR